VDEQDSEAVFKLNIFVGSGIGNGNGRRDVHHTGGVNFSNLCVPASGSGVLEAGMEKELGSTHTKGATREARVTFGI
jgi:hypothetical protein